MAQHLSTATIPAWRTSGYKFSDSTRAARRLPRLRRASSVLPARSPMASTIRFRTNKPATTRFRCAWTIAADPTIQQQFTFGFQRLNDTYNDNEPYSEQPLAALVENVRGPPPATYFVTPGESLRAAHRDSAGTYAGSNRCLLRAVSSLNHHRTKNRRLSGNALASRRRYGFRIRLSGSERQSIGCRCLAAPITASSRTCSRASAANLSDGGARVEHSSAFGTIGSGRGGASFPSFGRTWRAFLYLVPRERRPRRHRTQPA